MNYNITSKNKELIKEFCDEIINNVDAVELLYDISIDTVETMESDVYNTIWNFCVENSVLSMCYHSKAAEKFIDGEFERVCTAIKNSYPSFKIAEKTEKSAQEDFDLWISNWCKEANVSKEMKEKLVSYLKENVELNDAVLEKKYNEIEDKYIESIEH